MYCISHFFLILSSAWDTKSRLTRRWFWGGPSGNYIHSLYRASVKFCCNRLLIYGEINELLCATGRWRHTSRLQSPLLSRPHFAKKDYDTFWLRLQTLRVSVRHWWRDSIHCVWTHKHRTLVAQWLTMIVHSNLIPGHKTTCKSHKLTDELN